MKIALSTDTSCGISKELATKLNIQVFPLNVIVDGQEYLDGITINQDQLLKDMRGKKNIKTSTPPPGVIIDYFEKLFAKGYDKVLHFTISSKLSSMNTLFKDISHNNFDDKIIVIDSLSVCSTMLSHVLFAYEELQKNTDLETIQKLISERTTDGAIYFIPENLTALKNGGRISPAIATLCNIIGIKPVLHFVDGALEKDTVTKNPKRYLHDKLSQLIKLYPIKDYDYSIASFDSEKSLLSFLINEISLYDKDYHISVVNVPINVCAHCGPGTLGLLVSKKINNKSLSDYLM